MQNFDELKQLIENKTPAVIIPHQKPDADALGSCLALSLYLTKKECETKVISPTDYPEFLHWLPGNNDVIIYDEKNREEVEKIIQETPLIFCLDFNDLNRIDDLGDMVKKSPAKIALIDHHLDPKDFADFVYSDIRAAATAELIYNFIDWMDDKELIDLEIAENLYAGIMTDTGSFRFPSTSQKIHLITAHLISLGLQVARVHQKIYDNNTEDRLRFIGFCLSERMTVIPELHAAYIALSADDLKRFNVKTGDTEGLVNYALSIKGIVFAAIIVDRGGIIKMSYRSIGDFGVNTFAADHFSGGGHKNASGGSSRLSFEETVEKFKGLLPQYKEELIRVYEKEMNS